MVREEPKRSPEVYRQPNSAENSENVDDLFSPRFKSVAAMAGWDEEALIIASLVVEDTPDRQQSKRKKRSVLISSTPPCSTSRRKRRAQRRSHASTPIAPLNLDEEEQQISKQGDEEEIVVEDEKKTKVNEPAPLHCMDKLREELSCAICLDICFEPSTTPCGHSFCKKCLRSAADKCGKRCPKCRQLISNGRSCTVNTVLWNTIQLLFPKEVEARKAAAGAECQSPESGTRSGTRRTRTRTRIQDPALAARLQREDLARLVNTRRGGPARQQRDNDLSRLVSTTRRRRETPGQDGDAALALRMQREEFMEAFRGSSGQNISLARANLRAMASRAINRGRT
ncbi:LON peptidase N-terminal domain and RING finger protein 3-like isoform X2 [Hibiscus syriacus]|uniref:RING-type E3 ubiquitin transferase n=1 Tax=Hibiscus syriacus TaxID=106335 RepID=A0A6A3D5N0_HIBSY|nr:LON peptidase N-terminal domain and RING finger protein 3-like [Hibiscus syriacus]KAE8734592.1 LON peptidase N-terminal domain and RING finger protein 3-like isoform X2 [Hibiscus syriacus]